MTIEKIQLSPCLDIESSIERLDGNWSIDDFRFLAGKIDLIADRTLEDMRDPNVALKAWGTASYMLREFPQISFMGNKTMADFPQIYPDLVKRGTEYHKWLITKLNDKDLRENLVERAKLRTIVHQLEYLGRHEVKIDEEQRSVIETEFDGIPESYHHQTLWLSKLFNGLQIATVECFIEEEYFKVGGDK